MFLLTLFSWIAALLLAKLIRSTILRGPSTPFLLELPPYRLPTLKGLLIHTWERTWQYLRKAGTIILAISIVFWALMTYPQLPEAKRKLFDEKRQEMLSKFPGDSRISLMEGKNHGTSFSRETDSPAQELQALEREEAEAALQYSLAGRIGLYLEGLTQWCGFDWRTNVALLSGFAAKELIISTLGTAYSLGRSKRGEDIPLSEQLARDPGWNPASALAVIVFIMLYAPCLATVTCIIKEAGAWKWGLFSVVFNTSVAFLMATLIYQGGRWAGIGG
jgi:ferrous iron transport protein B